jgi:hypothetical protein
MAGHSANTQARWQAQAALNAQAEASKGQGGIPITVPTKRSHKAVLSASTSRKKPNPKADDIPELDDSDDDEDKGVTIPGGSNSRVQPNEKPTTTTAALNREVARGASSPRGIPLEKVPQSGAVLRSEAAPGMQEVLPEEVAPGMQEVKVRQREQVVAVGRS